MSAPDVSASLAVTLAACPSTPVTRSPAAAKFRDAAPSCSAPAFIFSTEVLVVWVRTATFCAICAEATPISLMAASTDADMLLTALVVRSAMTCSRVRLLSNTAA